MNNKEKKRKARQTMCAMCGNRKAVFLYRGRVKSDREHDLCPRCYRSEMDKLYAEQLVAKAS